MPNTTDDGFLQDPPRLGNQFIDDEFLRSQLRRLVASEAALQAIERDLESFGWKVATSIKELGFQAEAEAPVLQQFDAWCRRIDAVVTSPAWRRQKEVSAQEGLVAIAYERKWGEHSRVYQVAKLILYGSSSGLFNCPLAMTDGAARVCELHRAGLPELEAAFQCLTSRDPAAFWTSGQWMTEKAGGSDVAAATETAAAPEQEGRQRVGDWYRLSGYKWFTSAADGEMAFALAREAGPDGEPIPGNRGLTMFFVPVLRDAQGCPQNFEVVRLKNKLGTRQLPTAELRLRGMRGLKVSERGRGVPAIATMVNITRVHNSAAAVSFMRRITALAQDYARRRRAFGAPLAEQPLALRTLAWLELHTCACTALVMEAARLLGLQEAGAAAPPDLSLLRLLTPLAKLFTAKEAVAVASEGVEFFGGQGYIEDTHLPGILRDAQVLPIWEGTTNVLSLDLLRVLGGDPGAAPAFLQACTTRLASAAAAAAPAAPAAAGQRGRQQGSRVWRAMHAELLGRVCAAAGEAVQRVEPALMEAAEAVQRAGRGAGLPEGAQAGARDLAFALNRVLIAVLLAEHATWSGSPRHVLLAAEWCREQLGAGLEPPSGLSAAAAEEAKGAPPALDGRVLAARAIVGAGAPLTQPRARF